jgi:hypothetical protein
MRGLPVWITEADQNEPWVANGWILEAYREIDRWNRGERGSLSIVRALCLYRWGKYDQYAIDGRPDVQSEFVEACQLGLTWGDGEDSMWHEIHRDGLDEFYDQDGIGELTIPVGHRVKWVGDRPEMDAKSAALGHSEVLTPPYSAVGFLPYKKFRWWCYTVDPIPITRGLPTRGTSALMIDTHGVEGDSGRLGDCAMRVGVAPYLGVDPDPADGRIVWSEWWTVRDTDEYRDNQRVWGERTAPRPGEEFQPNADYVQLFIQCNADVAADISAGQPGSS